MSNKKLKLQQTKLTFKSTGNSGNSLTVISNNDVSDNVGELTVLAEVHREDCEQYGDLMRHSMLTSPNALKTCIAMRGTGQNLQDFRRNLKIQHLLRI
jgi:hypothetical protein